MDVLRCPVCSDALRGPERGALICARSHSFDIARQGYVSLLDGRSAGLRSDTAPMVAARQRIHRAGVFDPVREALASGVTDHLRPDGIVVDVGAGTGDYLAGILSEATLSGESNARGIGLDLSKYCARAITRSHERAAAVVADVWRGMPLADASVDVVCSVFAPRNLAEFARILRPGGAIAVVTPEPAHLTEIRDAMHMLGIDEGKGARLRTELSDFAEVDEPVRIEYPVDLRADLVADLVAMGPNAFHQTPEQIVHAADTVARQSAGDVVVTIAVTLTIAHRSR